jgi:hypothetical protein
MAGQQTDAARPFWATLCQTSLSMSAAHLPQLLPAVAHDIRKLRHPRQHATEHLQARAYPWPELQVSRAADERVLASPCTTRCAQSQPCTAVMTAPMWVAAHIACWVAAHCLIQSLKGITTSDGLQPAELCPVMSAGLHTSRCRLYTSSGPAGVCSVAARAARRPWRGSRAASACLGASQSTGCSLHDGRRHMYT